MTTEVPGSSPAEEPLAVDLARQRFAVHMQEIASNRDLFAHVSGELGGDGFAQSWGRKGTWQQARDRAALERCHEAIVNDLQEIFDSLEKAGASLGALPDPDQLDQDLSAWWAAAEALELPVAGADSTQRPGRWRRLAFYGHVDHDLASEVASYANTRQLFQHGYAFRNAARGHEVWDTMQSLQEVLPQLVDAIDALRARVIPPAAL